MATLLTQLTRHDWYYEYSDDHRVWRRGHLRQRELLDELKRLKCPHSVADVRMSVQDMILEDFVEEEPGKWYRHPRKYKSVAPARRENLIERGRAEEIIAWIRAQDQT